MIYLYGIPNCDSIKKARRWLDGKGLDHTFLNFKKQGADRATVEKWADRCGWESLLNRRGTSFLVIEHNMGVLMSLADRIVALHLGAKIAQGTPQEIQADARVIESYLGIAYA